MSENEDFVSFEKALRDLQMRSEELKKLVSEGEIRAFRDGASMKFRREDLDALATRSQGEDELAFVDALEDDTGMVTEELSDEDTLLAEDDLEEEMTPRRRAGRTAATSTRTRSRVADEDDAAEPGWVTAVAILGAVIMIWGLMVTFSIAAKADPDGSVFTSLFAK